MKKLLLVLSTMLFILTAGQSQSFFDFEDPGTSTQFQSFGGNLEGQLGEVIANPVTSSLEQTLLIQAAQWATQVQLGKEIQPVKFLVF